MEAEQVGAAARLGRLVEADGPAAIARRDGVEEAVKLAVVGGQGRQAGGRLAGRVVLAEVFGLQDQFVPTGRRTEIEGWPGWLAGRLELAVPLLVGGGFVEV